eukprot:119349-Prymnesium_polylepis.1
MRPDGSDRVRDLQRRETGTRRETESLPLSPHAQAFHGAMDGAPHAAPAAPWMSLLASGGSLFFCRSILPCTPPLNHSCGCVAGRGDPG